MSSSTSNGKACADGRRWPPTEWVARVFTQLEGALIAYTRRRLGGDHESACDVVQEAFVRLCRQRWPEIEPHATAWLYKTCRNRAIDITRREGFRSMNHSTADVTTLHDRSQSPPDDRAMQGEQIERMRTQIDELPDQQQEILRLRLQAGLSYKQIAQVTGLSVTNVGYHLHQAIASLRASLHG